MRSVCYVTRFVYEVYFEKFYLMRRIPVYCAGSVTSVCGYLYTLFCYLWCWCLSAAK